MNVRAMLTAILLLIGTTVSAQTPAPTIEYYHLDALGSVRAVTDQTGSVVRRHDYRPFGEGDGTSPGADPRRFTGKDRDAETGLDYFGARYYAQRTGRFVSVDPVLNVQAALLDPQRWNRYSYAKNNPLKYIDPDGQEISVVVNGRRIGMGLESVLPTNANPDAVFAVLVGIGAGAVLGPSLVTAGTTCALTPSCNIAATSLIASVAPGPSLPVVSGPGAVVGESVERVASVAGTMGMRRFVGSAASFDELLAQNMNWLRQQIARGEPILDLGLDAARASGRSRFYTEELKLLREAKWKKEFLGYFWVNGKSTEVHRWVQAK